MSGSNYDPLFQSAGASYQIDPLFLKAQDIVESGLRSGAISPAGAQGIAQFMPTTAESLGIGNPLVPSQAIPGQARLMNSLLRQNNDDPVMALRLYQGGPNRANWGPQNAAYPPKVAAVYARLKAQKQAEASASMPSSPAPAPAPAPAAQPAAANPAAMSDADLESFLTKGAAPTAQQSAPAQSAKDPTSMSDAELEAHLTDNVADPAQAKPGDIDPRTHQPYQFLSAADPNAPVVKSLGRPIADGREPGPLIQAEGSLPTDPEARRRIIAARLFPGMSPNEASAHVFYGTNGRLAAVDENGNPYYVDPETPSVYSPSSYSPSNLLNYAASSAGPALTTAGGVAGGMIAGPSSVVAGPALAGGGAALGDLLRQALAKHLDPDHPPIDYGQTAKEAALSAAGQLGGAVLGHVLAPNPLRIAPSDIRMAQTGNVLADANAATARAAAQGVDLTPGQATGLPSLLQYEDAAQRIPVAADFAHTFYAKQGNQLADAGQRMLDSISPVSDKTDAALQFQQGSEDAIRSVRQQANATARPAYNAAANAGQVMSPDLAQLADTPGVQSAMANARQVYQQLYRKAPPDTPDFAMWDLTKRSLDDAVTQAKMAGNDTMAMALDQTRQDLMTHLDAAYPTYAQARDLAAPGQRLAARLQNSGVGTVANGDGDERARAILAPVFNQSNPRAISEARDAFTAAGRQDEWNAGVRGYIQDAFDKASMSQEGLNPTMLRRQVWGNMDNRAAIQAALTPQQYSGFDNFMRTIEDAAKTYPMNSLTATRQNAVGALQAAGADQANVKVIGAIGTLLSPFRWAEAGGRMTDKVARGMVQRNMQSIIQRLFSPDGLQYLAGMASVPPGGQKAISATAQLIGRAMPSLLPAQSNAGSGPLGAPVGNPLLPGGVPPQ